MTYKGDIKMFSTFSGVRFMFKNYDAIIVKYSVLCCTQNNDAPCRPTKVY